MSAGARYMIGSALFFSLMTLMVKLVGARIPSQEIVLARGLVSLALSYALLRRAGLSPWGEHRKLLLLRGAFGFIGLSCFYYTVTELPIAEATVLQHTNPLWTAAIAAIVLSERLRLLVVLCALVSLVGVVLVAQPAAVFGGGGLDPVAVAVGIVGAVFSAAAYVVVRALGGREPPLVVVFYFPLIAVPAALPTVVPVFVLPRGVEWLLLLGIGVATQIAQVLMTRGLALEPAGRATAIRYIQIPFAALWGAIFFAELPTGWAIAGTVLIVAGSGTVALARARGGPDEDAADAVTRR